MSNDPSLSQAACMPGCRHVVTWALPTQRYEARSLLCLVMLLLDWKLCGAPCRVFWGLLVVVVVVVVV